LTLRGKLTLTLFAIGQVFDRDGGGDITFMEFRDGLKAMGLPITPQQIRQLYEDSAKTAGAGDGNLTIEDFAASLGATHDHDHNHKHNSNHLNPPNAKLNTRHGNPGKTCRGS